MDRSDVQVLFEHLYWMRDRILQTAERSSAPLTDAAAPTVRGLRATLVHELDVEWSWRQRLRSSDPTTFPPEDVELVADDFPDLASVRDRWIADEAEMRAWLASLTDADLAAPCRAEAIPGSHPFWYHLQHLYTHGIQQLSDAAVLLTGAGGSPGELDFLQFVDDRSGK